MRVAVLGAGSWGTALSLVLARNGHEVDLLGRASEDLEFLAARHENLRYLPGFRLPDEVRVSDLEHWNGVCDLCVLAVPSAAVRDVLAQARPQEHVVVASKGLDPVSETVLSDTVAEQWPAATLSALSGPNLAIELARGIPTVAVAASPVEPAAEAVRAAFMCRTYRVYVSDDLRGVELAGALKNVLAIAAGASDGLGYGDNTKGALMARGLSEIARIGLACGAKLDTFLGIAGVGDLFATASSTLSRNYRVGFGIGQGRALRDVLGEIGQVAEGVPTCRAAVHLAAKLGVEAPIIRALDAVLHGHVSPRDAVTQLMERLPRREGGLSEG